MNTGGWRARQCLINISASPRDHNPIEKRDAWLCERNTFRRFCPATCDKLIRASRMVNRVPCMALNDRKKGVTSLTGELQNTDIGVCFGNAGNFSFRFKNMSQISSRWTTKSRLMASLFMYAVSSLTFPRSITISTYFNTVDPCWKYILVLFYHRNHLSYDICVVKD